MNKIQYILIFVTIIFVQGNKLNAQDYQISFSILGNSNNPDSVLVENQVQYTNLLLLESDVLHLVKSSTDVYNINVSKRNIKVYPNPVKESAVIEFFSSSSDNITISIFDLRGNMIASQVVNITSGISSYIISGLKKGVNVVNISSEVKKYSAIIISTLNSEVTTSIKQNIAGQKVDFFNSMKAAKINSEAAYMQYNEGESLKFTAYLNSENSMKELIPTKSQIVSFDFTPFFPVTDFSADKAIIAVDSLVSFVDNSANNPTSWSWDFENDGIEDAINQNPTHIYDTTGFYSVTLTTRNEFGDSSITKTNFIDVGFLPGTDFIVDTTKTFVDSVIQFTDISTNYPFQWEWDFGDGIISALQNPNHSFDSSGMYTITLKSTNKYGSQSITKIDYIEIISNNYDTIVVDIDGNTYKTILLGNQLWMAENLRVTNYPNGLPIPKIEDENNNGSANDEWAALSDYSADDAYCWYNDDSLNYSSYGALYTWAAALGNTTASSSTNPSGVQGVCPPGWHLPSHEEWSELEFFLSANGYKYDGSTYTGDDRNIASNLLGKSIADSISWNSYASEGAIGNSDYPDYINKSGFSALASGYRSGYSGEFSQFGTRTEWITSTRSLAYTTGMYTRYLQNWSSNIHYSYSTYKSGGYSVRCVKD